MFLKFSRLFIPPLIAIVPIIIFHKIKYNWFSYLCVFCLVFFINYFFDKYLAEKFIHYPKKDNKKNQL